MKTARSCSENIDRLRHIGRHAGLMNSSPRAAAGKPMAVLNSLVVFHFWRCLCMQLSDDDCLWILNRSSKRRRRREERAESHDQKRNNWSSTTPPEGGAVLISLLPATRLIFFSGDSLCVYGQEKKLFTHHRMWFFCLRFLTAWRVLPFNVNQYHPRCPVLQASSSSGAVNQSERRSQLGFN